MIAVAVLLTETPPQLSPSRPDLQEIHSQLPFGRDPNTALGVVLKYHLEHFEEAGYKRERLKEVFPGCADPIGALKTGFEFWQELVTAIAQVPSGEIPGQTSQHLAEASALLSKARF